MNDLDGLAPALAAAQTAVRRVNETNGWFDRDRSFGEDIALLHSEVSEALEAYRDQGLTAWVTESGKPEGVGSELADVLVRLLDTCERYGVDLADEFARKLAYNAGRGHRHGGKHL